MSFEYKIYGLQISSSRRISILPETADLKIDLTVTWTTDTAHARGEKLTWEKMLTAGLKNRRGISFFTAQSGEGVYSKLCFSTEKADIFFLLDPEKKNLWIIHDKDESENDLDSYFVGPVLGCILRLRGVLCLHGSVINIDGKAVAFLGDKRTGKSTTAAAFAQRGFDVLTDDMAVITIKGDRFYLQSGYPKVRLRPASVAVMHPDADLPMVYTTRDSRYSNIEDSFCETELPLGAIYLLSKSEETNSLPFIEAMPLPTRMISLGKNTFGNYVITTQELRKKEFELLSRLALNVPVSRLQVVYNLNKLNLQCQAVIEDFRKMAEEEKI